MSECLPSLLSLAVDKVPNVRLALGRMVKDTLLSIGEGGWEDGCG